MVKRRVVTRDGYGRIGVREEPVPALGEGSVLVEVKASLISPGTELGGVVELRKNPEPSREAAAFGYGNAGVILETGDAVTGLEKGMRVACIGAGYAQHASHAVVPQNLAVPIPDGLSFEEAAFAHLAATALQAVRRSQVALGHTVAVFGLGIVGQVASQLARASGARVIGIDRLPLRLDIARKNGIDLAVDFSAADPVEAAGDFTGGYGIDIAIVAFGGDANIAIRQAVSMMKTAPDTHKMGTITIVGGARFEGQFPTPFGNIDIRSSSRCGPGYHDEAWERGADYPPVFVEWTSRRNLEVVTSFAAEGRLNVKSLITHRVALEEAPDACEELIDHPDRALGVIILP